MIKIDPIVHEIGLNRLNPSGKYITKISASTLGVAAAGVTGTYMDDYAFSDKYANFNKSINNNYFQLKTNPQTGVPYEPDVFQKTSANHLFLGDDVIVTAPTGTGKTAIAEYIITNNLREGKKTFYTTPLKALSNEKFRDFSKKYGENLVGLITGDEKINTKAPIIIMTTEVYRNMATSAYFDKTRQLPDDLRTVIFDELQYLGDVDRGGSLGNVYYAYPKRRSNALSFRYC